MSKNPVLGISDSTIRSIADLGEQAIETYLITTFPFLDLPVIHLVFHEILVLIENIGVEQLQRIATFVIVDIQTGAEQSKILSAAAIVKAAEATGDANALAQARQNFSDAFRSVVRYDGS